MCLHKELKKSTVELEVVGGGITVSGTWESPCL